MSVTSSIYGIMEWSDNVQGNIFTKEKTASKPCSVVIIDMQMLELVINQTAIQ